MEKSNNLLDVFSYSIIIHGFGCSGEASKALEMYKKMKKSGLRPNLVTFNTLIDVLGKAEMIFEVQEIVEEMTALGYKPDVITYTSLLPVVGKGSKGFRRQKMSATKCRFDHVLGIPLRRRS
jgi:pentatricopeptide repeat protein